MDRLTGNQLRELRQLQHWHNTSVIKFWPTGWTKGQVNVRRQLFELGYLEYIDPHATFKNYRLTEKGINFRG